MRCRIASQSEEAKDGIMRASGLVGLIAAVLNLGLTPTRVCAEDSFLALPSSAAGAF